MMVFGQIPGLWPELILTVSGVFKNPHSFLDFGFHSVNKIFNLSLLHYSEEISI